MSSDTIETAIRNMHVLQNHSQRNNATEITIRLMFLRIGKLDTREETFQARIAIEACWFSQSYDDENQILSLISHDEQIRLDNGETIKLPKDFPENNWHPQLFLLNTTRTHDEDIKYSIKKHGCRIQIREFRDVHETFYSKFDLHHFPTDIQELSVSIGSALFDTEITLKEDPNRASGINREVFIDQQEWRLYDHIQTRTKFLKGFLFQNDDDNELDMPGHQRQRSILTISCHAARRAKYFYWNGYCLIFLITIIAFSSFAIPYNGTQGRLNITCTLLLTSIAFRWTMSNSLPNISYLTLIDMYALVSIFVLIILCAWHSIIGSIGYLFNDHEQLSSGSYWIWLDQIVLCALIGLYTIVHVTMSVWHYHVPLARRRHMKELDRHYHPIVSENISRYESLSSKPALSKCSSPNLCDVRFDKLIIGDVTFDDIYLEDLYFDKLVVDDFQFRQLLSSQGYH